MVLYSMELFDIIEWNILTLKFKTHKKCPLWDNFKIINIYFWINIKIFIQNVSGFDWYESSG